MTSDPITAGLSQEMDVLPDDNHITDAWTHYYMFLDCIWSRKKLVWGSRNNGQKWSMEVEQDHMVMSRDMKDREVMAAVATWWCHREETQERVVE